MMCLFCRIAAKEIPATIRYEDDTVIAFDDIQPKAPAHVLVIPRAHVARLQDATDPALAAALFRGVQAVAVVTGIADRGYRLIVNDGPDGGQEVGHLHFHVVGGKRMGRMIEE